MAITIKKNTEYASANWAVELYTGETKLTADVLGLNITLKKGSISNPFSEVMANSCTLKTSYILLKGQQLSVHFVYADNDIEVFNGYVDDGDYDGEIHSYTLYSEDTRYNVPCPPLNFSDYPGYDGTTKKSVSLKWIIEQGCTVLGLSIPSYMPYEFECSTDIAFIEYQKYTMAQLISFYNASCAIMGYEVYFTRTSPILLIDNCYDDGLVSKFEYNGVKNAYIKQKVVLKTTETKSDTENGIESHEVETNTAVDYHIILTLDGSSISSTIQADEPTEISDNYIKIENPIPFGNSTLIDFSVKSKLEEFYANPTSGFHSFLTHYSDADLSEKSIKTFFIPSMVDYLGKTIAISDYNNTDYLIGDNYYIDDSGSTEFYQSIKMMFPVLQIDIEYDGGISCTLSTGGGLSNGSTTNTSVSDMVTLVGSSGGSSTAESIAILQNQIADLMANGITNRNFDEFLASADYLTLQSKLLTNIQSETITTDYLKASEAHVDWAEILQATIDSAMIKDASITTAKIEDASITNAKIADATIGFAKVDNAFITTLMADSAYLTNLNAQLADIGMLTADSAIIKNLQSETAKIANLESEVAKITYLEAKVADIDVLSADVADINTLIFGSASGEVIQTEFSNSVIAQLGDAQIKSAMIESLSADKITSGSIYTNQVRIYGDSSNKLSIVDNTIQINDSIRTRVQIGKDANNDYNMYVWDASGNLMFDALGITSSGITRKVIRDDVVMDNANISAEKLNIDTLFSVINNDSSHTLKSSKIYVDADNQTLDISFKTITSKVDTATETLQTVQNTVESQGTDISVIQGQISSKIWQQDITTAVETLGENVQSSITTLNTKYSSLEQKTDSIASIVASHTTEIANKADGSTVTTISDKVSSMQQSVDGIELTVQETTEKVNYMDSDITTLETKYSTLTQTVDGFKTEVSATYTTKTEFNDLEIGGRNLVRNGNFTSGNYWYHWGYPTTRELVTIDNKKWYHIKGSGTDIYQGINQNGTGIKIKKGSKYTFSARVKGASENQIFTVGFHWLNSSNSIVAQTWNDFTVSTTEQIVSFSFTTPEKEMSKFNIMLGVASASTVYEVYFTDIKFENGDKATPWTPAPEDTESQITALNEKYSNIEQTVDGISSTVASHSTQINNKADGSTVETISEQVSNIQQSVDGIQSTVQETTEKVNYMDSDITTLESTYSTLTQTVDGFKTEVSATYTTKTEFNDLEIGGRNLVRNGNFTSGNYWYHWGYPTTRELVTIDNKKWYHIKGSGTDIYQGINQNGTGIKIKKGSKYTFSARVKGASENQIFTVGFHWLNSSNSIVAQTWNDFTVSTTEQIVSFSFTTPEKEMSKFNIMLGVASASTVYEVYFTDIKFENGDKATPWTPAPEDTESQITGVKTVAEQTATQFKWLVKSGTSASDFTITDRLASLTADYINLNGVVTFSGLNSETQTKLSSSYSWTSTYGKLTNKAVAMTGNWADGDIASTTTIKGGKITTGSITADKIAAGAITADKINVTDLFSQNITASNFNITGGTVNISTSDIEDSAIVLKSKYNSYSYHSYMQASGLGANRSVSSSGTITTEYLTNLRYDGVQVYKYDSSASSDGYYYTKLRYDGIMSDGYMLFTPKIIKSGSIAYGSKLTLILTVNKVYIVLLQSWTTLESFGFYAFMCTNNNLVTTINAAYGQTVTLTSANILNVSNGNSNGATYYKVIEIF